MRRWSAFVVVCAGLVLWGCSDEEPGPGLGPDLSWQISCTRPNDADDTCRGSEDAHGPLTGLNEELDEDDHALKVVSCRRNSAGLQLSIEDPGATANSAKKIRARARSVLEVTNGAPKTDKCVVKVTEYNRADGRKVLTESCSGTMLDSGNEGTCKLVELEPDGYAFNGTLTCDGMRLGSGGVGGADHKLRAGGSSEPIALQIESCD